MEIDGTPIDRDKAIEFAARFGAEHGKAAGTWVTDGNTTRETFEALRRGIDDGDPMVLNMLPTSDLSGNDGTMTPAELFHECTGVHHDPASDGALAPPSAATALFDELIGAYELAFSEAVHDEVSRAVAIQLDER